MARKFASWPLSKTAGKEERADIHISPFFVRYLLRAKKRRSLSENGGLECFGLEFKADTGNHGIAFAVIVGVFFGTFGIKVSTDEEQINIFVGGIDV